MSETLADQERQFYTQELLGGSVGQGAASGKIGIGNTGKLVIAAAGNFRVTFTNDSSAAISIVRLSGLTTVTSFTTLFLTPTTGTPATVKTTNSAILGGTAPAGVVRADTSLVTPLSGGTDLGIAIGFGANMRTSIDLPPLIIAAGGVLGLNINTTAAADASFSLIWKVA